MAVFEIKPREQFKFKPSARVTWLCCTVYGGRARVGMTPEQEAEQQARGWTAIRAVRTDSPIGMQILRWLAGDEEAKPRPDVVHAMSREFYPHQLEQAVKIG